jgi:peptidoglycan hydrolase-like protein with peptidoglycan-binding domain
MDATPHPTLRLIRNNIMSIETMSAQTASAPTMSAQTAANQALNKPVLNIGAQGTAVVELQNLLNGYANYLANGASNSFRVTVDGDFGPMTLTAVRAFQRQVFLPKTGTVANLTWQALYLRGPVNMPKIQYISPTNFSSGSFVTLLQQALVSLGYLTASQVDGSFGPITKAKVIIYQTAKSLPNIGVVHTDTWFSLSKQYRP